MSFKIFASLLTGLAFLANPEPTEATMYSCVKSQPEPVAKLAFLRNERAVRPEQFGAIGDGSTDDTVALAKADSFAAKHNLYLSLSPSRTYLIANFRPRTRGIIGGHSTIKFTDNGDGPGLVLTGNQIVSDLAVDANGRLNGIHITDTKNITINNIIVRNSSYSGIYSDNVSGLFIHNSTVVGNRFGFFFRNLNNFFLDNVVAMNNGLSRYRNDHGITLKHAHDGLIRNVTVARNAAIGLEIARGINISIERLCTYMNGSMGLSIANSTRISAREIQVRETNLYGIEIAATLGSSRIAFDHAQVTGYPLRPGQNRLDRGWSISGKVEELFISNSRAEGAVRNLEASGFSRKITLQNFISRNPISNGIHLKASAVQLKDVVAEGGQVSLVLDGAKDVRLSETLTPMGILMINPPVSFQEVRKAGQKGSNERFVVRSR